MARDADVTATTRAGLEQDVAVAVVAAAAATAAAAIATAYLDETGMRGCKVDPEARNETSR